MSNTTDKLPPHSLEAEMCLLGSMLIAPDFAREVLPTLRPNSFFLTDHRIVFETIAALHAANRAVDLIVLRDELSKAGEYEKIGGAAMLAQLVGTVPSAAHGPEYAARVREHAARRQLIGLADNIIRRAQNGQYDVAALASEITAEAAAVLADRSAGDIITFADAVEAAYDGLDEGSADLIQTGLSAVDAIVGGFGAGETVITAGRPSMGKSTFLRTISKNVGAQGIPVGFISLEESPAKIARNALASEASVDNHRIRSANMDRDQWNRLGDAVVRLQKLPIFISRNARSVDEIRAVATTMKQKHRCRLLIVDHLSRVRAPGKSLYEQTTNASGAISDLIKDLGVAGLVACQLNRGVEHRDDPRPTMADLRDSGAIEQDADGVLLLHRDDYFRVGTPGYEPTGIADVIVAKWRDGVRGGTARIKSDLRFQRFVDLPRSLESSYTGESN